MRKHKAKLPTYRTNLYQFIRLMLGNKIADRTIARKWRMDTKNFSDLKYGKYPVPRVERLVSLGKILNIDDHLVYEVARGTPAQRVYHVIEKLHLRGDRRPLIFRLPGVNKIVRQSERHYQRLFAHVADAIFIADVKTGLIIECNKKAELLVGRRRPEIIGLHHLKLHPPAQAAYYRRRFQVRAGSNGQRLNFVPAHVLRKDGRVIPVLINAHVVKLDGRLVLHGAFRDISRFKLGPGK